MNAKVPVLLTLLLASLHSEVGGMYKVLFELCMCTKLARLRACKSDENIVLPTTSSSTHGVVINFTLMCSKDVIQVHACFGAFSVVQ